MWVVLPSLTLLYFDFLSLNSDSVVYHHVDTVVRLVHTELVETRCHWDQVASIDLEAAAHDVGAAARKWFFVLLFFCYSLTQKKIREQLRGFLCSLIQLSHNA